MKTLYEILEVSETASNEVIEKAYKVLAKKYHPDLQTPENKTTAENKMKEINEAYETLSNEQKRKEYDAELAYKREEEKNKNTVNQSMDYRQYQNNQSNESYTNQSYMNNNQYAQSDNIYNKVDDMQRRRYEEQLRKQEEKMRKQMQENLQREYENIYYGYLRSLGYKIKERWTWRKTKQLIIVIAVLIVICIGLWFFPPTHNMLVEFYENNRIVKIIVDIIVNIVRALFESIANLFTQNK